MAYNPRFPYTFQVLRAVMDENGEPAYGENAEPLYRAVVLDVAEYEGQMPKMVTKITPSDSMLLDEENVFIVTEDGKYLIVGEEMVKDQVPVTRQKVRVPFGYRQQTANAVINGDVIIAEMKIACPLILGDIRTKDLLELTDNDRTFRAEVVKKINTNFGSNIWYNEVKQ